MIKIIIIITTLLFSSKVVSQSSTESVDNLFKATKIDSDFNQINTVLEAKIKEKKPLIKQEDKYLKFSKILKKSFNSEKTTSYLRDYFLENGEENTLIKIVELYDNPLMVRMNGYEQSFYDSNNKESQMAFFKDMKTNPPKQDRIKLLLRLNEALRATVKSRNLLENIMTIVSKSYNSILPKEKQSNISILKAKVKSELPESLSQQITNQFVAIGLYTYRLASDEELNDYIKIWESDLGISYTNALFKGYEFVFYKISSDLMTNLNKAF
jgi:hypothetical protein